MLQALHSGDRIHTQACAAGNTLIQTPHTQQPHILPFSHSLTLSLPVRDLFVEVLLDKLSGSALSLPLVHMLARPCDEEFFAQTMEFIFSHANTLGDDMIRLRNLYKGQNDTLSLSSREISLALLCESETLADYHYCKGIYNKETILTRHAQRTLSRSNAHSLSPHSPHLPHSAISPENTRIVQSEQFARFRRERIAHLRYKDRCVFRELN